MSYDLTDDDTIASLQRMANNYSDFPNDFAEYYGDAVYIYAFNHGWLPRADAHDEIMARNPELAPHKSPRKSSRISKIPVFVPDNDCTGVRDPITFAAIINGIRVTEGGVSRCYDINTLANLKPRISPFTREPFSAEVNARIDTFIHSREASGVKKSKKSKKIKSSKKSKKNKRTTRRFR